MDLHYGLGKGLRNVGVSAFNRQNTMLEVSVVDAKLQFQRRNTYELKDNQLDSKKRGHLVNTVPR